MRRTFRGSATAWNRLYWRRTVVAWEEGTPLTPRCSCMLRMGVSPLSECAFVSAAVSSGPPWERPGELCHSTAAETLYSPIILHWSWACCMPNSLCIHPASHGKEERVGTSRQGASQQDEAQGLGWAHDAQKVRCVCQLTESMNFQLDAVLQVFTFVLTLVCSLRKHNPSSFPCDLISLPSFLEKVKIWSSAQCKVVAVVSIPAKRRTWRTQTRLSLSYCRAGVAFNLLARDGWV